MKKIIQIIKEEIQNIMNEKTSSEEENFWRDTFQTYGGQMRVKDVLRLIKAKPDLRQSFESLLEPSQQGGQYIKKEGEMFIWPEMMTEIENAPPIFTVENMKEEAQKIHDLIEAPVKGVSISTLGGQNRPVMLISLSLDPKESWSNGIYENSRYMRFHFSYDGELYQFTKAHTISDKFRKTRVKTIDEVPAKINAYLQKIENTSSTISTIKESPSKNLSVPEKHQLKIAIQTLKYSDAGARIMGGPTKEEAREIIKKLTGKNASMEEGFSDFEINPIKSREGKLEEIGEPEPEIKNVAKEYYDALRSTRPKLNVISINYEKSNKHNLPQFYTCLTFTAIIQDNMNYLSSNKELQSIIGNLKNKYSKYYFQWNIPTTQNQKEEYKKLRQVYPEL